MLTSALVWVEVELSLVEAELGNKIKDNKTINLIKKSCEETRRFPNNNKAPSPSRAS